MDNIETSRVIEKAFEIHDEDETSVKQPYEDRKKFIVRELWISFNGLIPVNQLRDFIKGTIKNKLDGGAKSTLLYAKPYSTRINNLNMLTDCQPHKF